MIATNNINDIQDFDNICTKVMQKCEPVTATRLNNSYVIISKNDYDNLIENMYIRKSDANYQRLIKSINQAKHENLITPNLEEYND